MSTGGHTSPRTLLPNGYEYLGLEVLDNNHTYAVPGLDQSRVYVASEIRDALDSAPDLLAALNQAARRFSRIACGELAGITAKHSAKSGLDEIESILARCSKEGGDK